MRIRFFSIRFELILIIEGCYKNVLNGNFCFHFEKYKMLLLEICLVVFMTGRSCIVKYCSCVCK